MPTSSLIPPAPWRGPQKVAPTPEQIAKIVVAKLKSPVGLPDKAEISLRLSLPRVVLERLTARAMREGRKARSDHSGDPRRRGQVAPPQHGDLRRATVYE